MQLHIDKGVRKNLNVFFSNTNSGLIHFFFDIELKYKCI